MGGKIEKAEMGAFVTEGSGFSGRKTGGGRRSGRRNRQRKRRCQGVYAASMLIKLGVCAAALVAVLLLKLVQAPVQGNGYALTQDGDARGQDEFDEMLGKLRFVELPGILEVFAPDERMALPVAAKACTLMAEDTLLKLEVEENQSVKAALAGKVKAVGESEQYGLYVEMVLDNGLEVACYGLSSVSVETGQPVAQSDDIGETEGGSAIFLGLKENGRPQNPLDYYRTDPGL